MADSEKYQKEALKEIQSSNAESFTAAAILSRLGDFVYQRGDLVKSQEYDRQVLEIRQKLAPGSLAVAGSLNNIGVDALDRGNLDEAEVRLRQALDIQRRLAPGTLNESAYLNNLGDVAKERGDLSEATGYYGKSLEIRERIESGSLDVAASFNNLGAIAEERGELSKAEDYQDNALKIQQKLVPNSLAVALSLIDLGDVAFDRADLDRAGECYRQAMAIHEKFSVRGVDTAGILKRLGAVAEARGNLGEANEFFKQALELLERLSPGSPAVAFSLMNLGEVARDRGDIVVAEEFFQRSLTIDKKIVPGSPAVATILNNLGEDALYRHDKTKASEYFGQSLEIRKKLAPESVDYAESLANLAGVRRDQDQAEESMRLYAQAIDVLENQVAHLGGSSDIRASFRAKHASYYAAYSDLLLSQKQPERAFEVLERSQARTLMEMLAEAHVDIRRGADPTLLDRERTLRVRLAAKSSRRINLLEGTHSEEQVAAFSKEIDQLLRQLQEVEGQIRTSNPIYAGLTQPQPLSAREVQQQLFDTDTVLLEYSLGEKHSLVFVLTPTSLDSYELPKRTDIDGAAHYFYDLLTTRNRWIDGETNSQRKERLAKAEAEYQKAATTLSKMILGPVEARLERKRLLIVADGALQYIPFAVLPIPDGNPSKPTVPLVAEHEIVNLPSASLLALLRRQANGRGVAPKEVVVLADPVFDKQDPRVAVAAKNNQAIVAALGRETIPPSSEQLALSLRDVGLAGAALPRLAFSRREADSIMAMTDTGKGMEAVDFEANRETALNKDLGQYRIVHFATHGLLDNEHPELSGLVLSLVDKDGKPRDGFLDLEDVYNLTLPADLVVLSACETGLGKQINGEGLIGLTRGFMYAGASRVVASLWKVDDVATAELMGRFYRAMLEEGLRPAAALRRAQIEMQQQKRWADPYYWAAFTIQGDWK